MGLSVGTVEEVALSSDFLLLAPGTGTVLTADLQVAQALSRKNPVLRVDPAQWIWTGPDLQLFLPDRSLQNQTIGFYGLGTIGGTAASFLKRFGANIIAVVRHPDDYRSIGERLNVSFVSPEQIWRKARLVLLSLPADAGQVVTPEILDDPTTITELIGNIGRGDAVAGTLSEEESFVQALLRTGRAYSTDVLPNEKLEWQKQPLRALVESGQAIVSSHIASNAENPLTKISVRGLMEGTAVNNLLVMRHNQLQPGDPRPLPNPIPAPAGQEEVAAAEQRVAAVIDQLVRKSQFSVKQKVVAIGPSVYQSKDYDFLPAFVETYFGPVQERIFFDPVNPQNRESVWDTQFDWNAGDGEYGKRVDLVSYLGSSDEQSDFNRWAQTHLQVNFSTLHWQKEPAKFLHELLRELALPFNILSVNEDQQLQADLELLVSS